MPHRHATSFVLGYHGTDKATGEAILAGERSMIRSENSYDWLGPGIYFWEADPVRALEWAEEWCGRKGRPDPFVIGAVIDLGRCLDLVSRRSIAAVRAAYESLEDMHRSGRYPGPLPRNKGQTLDFERRHLDCAVIRHLHYLDSTVAGNPPFETVRGLFREGEAIYENAGFFEKTHIQIAVVDPANIKGFFRLPAVPSG